MEGIHVHQIALPYQFLIDGLEVDSGEVGDWTSRAVVTGNPFWIHERYRAGLHRNSNPGVDEVTRSVGCINRKMFVDGGLRTQGKTKNCRDNKSAERLHQFSRSKSVQQSTLWYLFGVHEAKTPFCNAESSAFKSGYSGRSLTVPTLIPSPTRVQAAGNL